MQECQVEIGYAELRLASSVDRIINLLNELNAQSPVLFSYSILIS